MGIAHELITRGWTQGTFNGPDGSVCLAEAQRRATAALSTEHAHRAEDALRQVIGDGWPICVWNDLPGRTFDEVLRVAKQADEILDNQ